MNHDFPIPWAKNMFSEKFFVSFMARRGILYRNVGKILRNALKSKLIVQVDKGIYMLNPKYIKLFKRILQRM